MWGERRATPHRGSSSDALPSMQEKGSWQAAAGREEATASEVRQYWKELGKQQFIQQYSGKFNKNKIEYNYLFVAADQPGRNKKTLEA